MSELTSWIGHASFAACVALIVHAVFARWRAAATVPKVRWWKLWFLVALECGSLWIWLRFSLPLLAWGLWIGDNEHWFYDYAWLFAGAIAVAVAAVSFHHLRTGQATVAYARIHFWTPVLLLLSFGFAASYEYLRLIEGWTADEAAENVLARLAPRIGEPVRLVPHSGPVPHGLNPGSKVYWIMGAKEPRGRLSVRRYGRYWWTFSHHEIFPPSSQELDRAKEWMKSYPKGAVLILRHIVECYPNTPAETEAKELLRSLRQSAE